MAQRPMKNHKMELLLNPLIVIKKIEFIISLLDARLLNSSTGQSTDSWLWKPLSTQLGRANFVYRYAIDLMYAYAQATLDDELLNKLDFHLVRNFLL